MNLPDYQPAKTYDFNIVLSLLDRCCLDELSDDDAGLIRENLVEVLALLSKSKPVLPHGDPVLVEKFRGRLEGVLSLLGEARLRDLLGDVMLRDLVKGVRGLLDELGRIRSGGGLFVDLSEVEEMFAMEGMYVGASMVAEEELVDKKQLFHPQIPAYLNVPVEIDQTRQLIDYVCENMFEGPSLSDVKFSFLNDFSGRHLFWSTTEGVVRYGTPVGYDLATQFSFDVPHNVAHLFHLSACSELSVSTYLDTMRERAYFETVAVLSEHQFITLFREGGVHGESLWSLISGDKGISESEVKEFSAWLLADRVFEARLRVARLLADIFTFEGGGFEEVSRKVAEKVGLDFDVARAEVYKYYTLTGLGGVYVLGPKRLMGMGIKNPVDAIFDSEGNVVRNWRDVM